MFQRAAYQHPELEPFSRGTWSEVVFSWVAAAGILCAVLALL